MATEHRTRFDLALVVTALILVFAAPVSASNPVSVVGGVVGAILGISPIAYLVVLGLGGIIFMAYALLYLPSQQGQ